VVVVAGDDLLFSSRIEATLTTLGYRSITVQTMAVFQDALGRGPVAAILNLASHRFDAIAAIRRARGDAASPRIALLGFCGHADTARQEAARSAGCDLVATNGEVAGHLPRLLRTLLHGAPPRDIAP
jgi:DNA-binding response OmpR family regulator